MINGASDLLVEIFGPAPFPLEGAYQEFVRFAYTSLDATLRELSEGYDGHAILTNHPAHNYLARRYGLKVVNLDLDPEVMPESFDFPEASHILWECEPAEEIAARMKEEAGLASVVFSPCEAAPESGQDYLDVMRANVMRLRPVLAGE